MKAKRVIIALGIMAAMFTIVQYGQGSPATLAPGPYPKVIVQTGTTGSVALSAVEGSCKVPNACAVLPVRAWVESGYLRTSLVWTTMAEANDGDDIIAYRPSTLSPLDYAYATRCAHLTGGKLAECRAWVKADLSSSALHTEEEWSSANYSVHVKVHGRVKGEPFGYWH